MKFKSISSPVMQPEGILLTVTLPSGEIGPFLATSSAPEDYCRDIFNRAVAGEFGEIAPYVAPVPSDAEKLASMKSDALAAIEATDMVALRCLKNGVEYTIDWRLYYQALLAIVRMEEWAEGARLPTIPSEYPAGS